MAKLKVNLACFYNPLLALFALFNVSLTLYCCTQFYAYLPTSDTWVHMDFLVHAAQGKLELAQLFEKHNGIHLIALPKLIYFLDMWLTRGSGTLIVWASLLALLATAVIIICVLFQTGTLKKTEKYTISFLVISLIFSASQSQSLLNPANLQWSFLALFFTLTAYYFYQYQQHRTFKNGLGVAIGGAGISLSSASILLFLIPLGLMLVFIRFGRCKALKIIFLCVMGLIVTICLLELADYLFFKEYKPVLLMLLEFISGESVTLIKDQNYYLKDSGTFLLYARVISGFIKFQIDFLLPSLERTNNIFLSVTGLMVLITIGVLIWREKKEKSADEFIFFETIMWQIIFSSIVIGLARSHTGIAFTYRFVNLGLLFNLCLIIYSMVYFKQNKNLGVCIKIFSIIYLGLLSVINITEASAFGYGRNHIRLTQIAYSLDIREPYAIVSMPGTVWQDIEYKFIQENLYKLKSVGAGVFSDSIYKIIDKPVDSFINNKKMVDCIFKVNKARRLLPDQAGYKLIGESKTREGAVLSKVLFVDIKGIVRGFAISIMPTRNIFSSLIKGKYWAGFVNLDAATEQYQVLAYAYDGEKVCNSTAVQLPEYKPFVKKNRNEED